jgi:hypothetical protein
VPTRLRVQGRRPGREVLAGRGGELGRIDAPGEQVFAVDQDVEAAARQGERDDQAGRALGDERNGVGGWARAQDVERGVGRLADGAG